MIKSKSSWKSVGLDFHKIQFSSSIQCLNKMQILHIVTENICPDYMNALCLLEGIFLRCSHLTRQLFYVQISVAVALQ